jgi:lipopolysaccharide assembly outer membrane protein LptD (OstA)
MGQDSRPEEDVAEGRAKFGGSRLLGDAAQETPGATPAEASCEKGCLRAETQGGSDEHVWAAGFVDFQFGEVRIQSDRFDRYQERDAQGRSTSRVVAQGNVVFQRGEERLAGDRLEMDLANGTAVLENAFGFVQPDVFVEATRIERLDAERYRIEGARFTSCSQPNPRWRFSAGSATLKRDERVVAKNVVFHVKSVPVLYLPIFYYPIREDQRSTGFLFPRFGFSSYRGYNVGSGFFWAMGRNYDQTFSLDYYSRFGSGYGHELRYVGLGVSNLTAQTTLFQRSDVDAWDYDLQWNGVQSLPGGFRTTLNARLFSSTAYQQRAQDSLNRASDRNQRANFTVQGRLLGQSIRLVADHNETFFGETSSRVNQRLPSLRVSRSSRRIGNTGIAFGYQAGAERLARGDEEVRVPYNRFDVAPSLSRPWATSFLQLDPKLEFRYTRYSSSVLEEGPVGPPINRSVFESNVDLRGPMFAKIFSLGGFVSPRFKHEIGPELTWTYRSAVEDFDTIPKFDGTDQLLGTNQLRYSLMQRLLAKRPDHSGRLTTFEMLSWRISQTYFQNIAAGQNEFDPNYSTAFFGPGDVPSHYSPLQSRFRLSPNREISASFDVEYDVNFKQLRSLGVGLDARYANGTLRMGWSKAERLAEVAEDRVTVRNTVRGAGSLDLWRDYVELAAAVDYDFTRKTLIRSSGRLRVGVQCCGLMVEMINFNYNQRTERQFRFALELANIGSFGFGTDGQGLGVQ